MHIKEDVELFLLARGDGMIVRDAASSPASGWAPPRGGRSGTCPGAAPAGPGARVESGATMSERPEGSPSEDRGQGAVRAARDGAARRDDARPDRETAAQGGVGQPKRGLAPPPSTPMRSRCELGERLRLATGLLSSAITRFLEMPRSTWYYHRARAGRATTSCGPWWRRPSRCAADAATGPYGRSYGSAASALRGRSCAG